MLKRPDFIERDGALITAIFCKVCGEQIAQIVKNEQTGGERLQRFNIYREVTIEHWPEHARTNTDFHVTHLCVKCAESVLDAETLNEIYKADLVDMDRKPDTEIPEAWKTRQPRRMVKIEEAG